MDLVLALIQRGGTDGECDAAKAAFGRLVQHANYGMTNLSREQKEGFRYRLSQFSRAVSGTVAAPRKYEEPAFIKMTRLAYAKKLLQDLLGRKERLNKLSLLRIPFSGRILQERMVEIDDEIKKLADFVE